jgi:hypothetical protein
MFVGLCIVYTQTRAGRVAAQSASSIDSNSEAQAQRLDGVAILFSSVPGIARGEIARYTFLNAWPTKVGVTEEPVGQPVSFQVSLLDGTGKVIAESAEVTVPAGGFGLIDFKRSDIPAAGDSLTGRVETSAKIRTVPLWGLRARPLIQVQVIDDISGKTTVAESLSPTAPLSDPAIAPR